VNAQARGAAELSPQQRDTITLVLSNGQFPFAARAAHLWRAAPDLGFNVSARFAYVLIAGAMTKQGTATIARATLAKWLAVDKRTVTRIVRELTRSGPLPLLAVTPGRKGHGVSVFQWVSNPCAFAEAQEAAAAEIRAKRAPAVLDAQAHIYAQQPDTPERAAALARTTQRREWALPTRKPKPQLAPLLATGTDGAADASGFTPLAKLRREARATLQRAAQGARR
jgi:hypothetical protein